MIASVVLREAVPAIDRIFDYIVPDEMLSLIQVGQYIHVPFGRSNRSVVALVVNLSEQSVFGDDLKSIIDIMDPIPVLAPDQVTLLEAVRTRYACTYGDVIRLMVPAYVSDKKNPTRNTAVLIDEQKAIEVLNEGDLSSLPQIRVLELLLECKRSPVSEIMSALSVSVSPIHSLRDRGLIEIIRDKSVLPQLVDDSPKEENNESEKDSIDGEEAAHVPAEEQAEAIAQILGVDVDQIDCDVNLKDIWDESNELREANDKYSEFLLYGVTGSGKTEVYLQCAAEILRRGGSVLFLVPEIALTPQMIRWVSARFLEVPAVIHSRLTPKQRFEQWDSIRKGKTRIVIGARSAVFAPMKDLQLIIVDEEHDTSYKSETHPRYHARDVARMRAKLLCAKLVLGSATPAVETYYSAQMGFTKLLRLKDRVNQAHLPKVTIVDMRQELKRGNRSVISEALMAAMREELSHGRQVMLFLNKRGYSSFILCRSCGESIMCPHCSVSMTVHSPKGRRPVLICHYCMRTMKIPELCPQCQSPMQAKMGLGTQQLEEAVAKAFPGEKVLRMDQDTTAVKDAHATLLEAFRKHEASILIGTQMIAKGHDFPDVTVVGIISADMLIRASDFKAGERAFQLITQSSGRAGRGEAAGRVYIQTYQPDDDLIVCAASQNYDAFFKNEIEFRRRMHYPPFLAMGTMVISSENEEQGFSQAKEVKAFVERLVEAHQDNISVDVFGPGPAPIYRVRDRYRFFLNIKAKNKSTLARIFRALSDHYSDTGLNIAMDIDPIW